MSYEQKGKELGKLVAQKQKAYGNSVDQATELMKIYLKKYKNDDNTYTIPENLLQHILLQVRIIDKQNRIFNNPDGDLMQESPYRDISGYGLLGEEMGRVRTEKQSDKDMLSMYASDVSYETSYEQM